MAVSALEGVRVLEFCHRISGPYCTKLMGDLGAEVIHIEPPGRGDDTRRLPPFLGDTPHPDHSGLFLFLNTNKLGITLDPHLPGGADIVRRLAASADVLVEDWPPGHLEGLGLGYDELRHSAPALIVASITPFGRSGPYSQYRAHGLNVSHASGQGYTLPLVSPHLERAPVQVGGHCTEYDCGQTAAVAILAALYARALTGSGQLIEVSEQEAALSLQRVESVAFANEGTVITRRGQDKERAVTQLFPCQDGYVVCVTPLEHQQQALAQLAADASSDDSGAAGVEGMTDRLPAWMAAHTRAEICARGQARSCPTAPMNSAADVLQSPQMTARGFFAEVVHPRAGPVSMPARPCHFSRTPVARLRAAPRLGEHNAVIYGKRLGYSPDELRALRARGVI